MTTFEAPRIEVVENALEPADQPQPRRRRVKRRTVNTIIWFVVLLALTAIVLYPLVWLFFSTFKPSSEFGQNPGLMPENPTFANYAKVVEGIAGTPLWRFFANSFFIAVMAVIGTVFSASLAAYAFARIRFRGVGILFAAMIGTLLLPFHVIIIPQYIMFQKLDLVDTATDLDRQKNGEFQAYTAPASVHMDDPDLYYARFTCQAVSNYGKYCNPEFDRLFAAQNRTFDDDKRVEITRKMERILLAEMPDDRGYYWKSSMGYWNRVQNWPPLLGTTVYNYGKFEQVWCKGGQCM